MVFVARIDVVRQGLYIIVGNACLFDVSEYRIHLVGRLLLSVRNGRCLFLYRKSKCRYVRSSDNVTRSRYGDRIGDRHAGADVANLFDRTDSLCRHECDKESEEGY